MKQVKHQFQSSPQVKYHFDRCTLGKTYEFKRGVDFSEAFRMQHAAYHYAYKHRLAINSQCLDGGDRFVVRFSKKGK